MGTGTVCAASVAPIVVVDSQPDDHPMRCARHFLGRHFHVTIVSAWRICAVVRGRGGRCSVS